MDDEWLNKDVSNFACKEEVFNDPLEMIVVTPPVCFFVKKYNVPIRVATSIPPHYS